MFSIHTVTFFDPVLENIWKRHTCLEKSSQRYMGGFKFIQCNFLTEGNVTSGAFQRRMIGQFDWNFRRQYLYAESWRFSEELLLPLQSVADAEFVKNFSRKFLQNCRQIFSS